MPMSYKTLNRKRGTIEYKGMRMAVRILDRKNSYGRQRYKVEPVAGSGTAWVENIGKDS